MAVQTAVALTTSLTDGGGKGTITNFTGTTSTIKHTNISKNHPLYPGIVGSNSQCSLFSNKPQVYIIDGNKLSGEGATYFNSGYVWHTHTINNTVYELVYHNNTYWYKLKGATANVYNTTNINTSALDNLIKITYILTQSLDTTTNSSTSSSNQTVKELSETVEELTKGNTVKESSNYTNETTKPTKTDNNIEIVINKPCIIPQYKPNLDEITKTGKIKFEPTTQNVEISYIYNLKNIVPNPLYNNYINDNYDDIEYATGDIYGEDNTTYLRYNKDNISNNILKEYYIPSIGELGLSMENIQIINDSIESLGEEYLDCKIPYDSIIPSSTLYYSSNILNDEYKVTQNINNVWCFDNSKAEITCKPINGQFIPLPFYVYRNNVVINLEEDLEDVVINSIETIESANGISYKEENQPIHDFRLDVSSYSDLNVDNWLTYPFSSKYFYKILFPEVSNYLYNNYNFTQLHDQYLTYYKYYSVNVDDANEAKIPTQKLNTTPPSTYTNISAKISDNFVSNNGVLYPSYIQGGNLVLDTSKFWQHYIIYNVPIYGNHFVILPIKGSSENNFNSNTNKVECELYVAIPSECTNFKCVVGNGYSDATVSSSQFVHAKGFSIYSIYISFKSYYASENTITFSCKYQGKEYTKQYFYSVYSMNISNVLSNDTTCATKITLDNYYVSRDPYYWWKINSWNTTCADWSYTKSPKHNEEAQTNTYYVGDGFGKLFDNSYTITHNYNSGDINVTLTNQKEYTKFVSVNNIEFISNYNLSYLIDKIGYDMRILMGHGTISNRGLRVDRLIDGDISMTYNIEDDSIHDYYSTFNYIDENTHTLTNNYHILKMDVNIPTKYKNYFNINSFNPMLRINRSVDQYGMYNDLIFAKLTKNITDVSDPGINDFSSIMFYVNSDHILQKNKVRLNLPIVGAKQSLCLGFDLMEYCNNETLVNRLHYLLTDYLFIFNNTNSVITLIIIDPSLSISSKMNNAIKIEPNELKLYYPNNFNYNDTSNNNVNKIYQITLIDKNNKDILFYHYHLGASNNAIYNYNDDNGYNDKNSYNAISKLLYKYNKCTTENIYIDSNDSLHNHKIDYGARPEYLTSMNKNKIVIDIQNYLENKTGHLVVLESTAK